MDYLSFQEISTEGIFPELDPFTDHIPALFNENMGEIITIPVLQEVDVPLEYYSLDKVKDLLGRSERTIRRYAKEGYIQAEYRTVDGHRRILYTNRSVLAVKLLIENKPNFHYTGNSIQWFYKELLNIFYSYYRETMKNPDMGAKNFMQFVQQEFNSL